MLGGKTLASIPTIICGYLDINRSKKRADNISSLLQQIKNSRVKKDDKASIGWCKTIYLTLFENAEYVNNNKHVQQKG